MLITQLTPDYFDAVIALANDVHGDNYIDQQSLKEIYNKGVKKGINASFIALDNNKLVGVRLSYAPGNWQIDAWCSPKLWHHKSESVAYFKCIAIDKSQQGKGIGPQLLAASIAALKEQGATAGIAHLWRQSPGNGAVKYFTKAGGILIKNHPDRWLKQCQEEGYLCTLCGRDCHCEAAEMILPFK